MVISWGPQGSERRKHEVLWGSVFRAMGAASAKPGGEVGLAWGVPEEHGGHHDRRVVREGAGSDPAKLWG